ncbi:hypothetical protein Pth03_74590 [Planotetraspora thailandica]|uniref:Uncharacterized protein n=1 Tax=Planotetraspora thailandica TaxID=487172 RepID=A0A8J4DF28_9ACTN|nr:hypothetical protein Pth03_74590 [Planotetraspora thailandica]
MNYHICLLHCGPKNIQIIQTALPRLHSELNELLAGLVRAGQPRYRVPSTDQM